METSVQNTAGRCFGVAISYNGLLKVYKVGKTIDRVTISRDLWQNQFPTDINFSGE